MSKLPRLQFITYTYRFFEANLLVFFALLLVTGAAQQNLVGGVFFVWTSVFNLFVVSVFWAFMVDVFTPRAGQAAVRLHRARAPPSARCCGSAIPASLCRALGTTPLLLVSVVLLEIARIRDAPAVGHRHGPEDQRPAWHGGGEPPSAAA